MHLMLFSELFCMVGTINFSSFQLKLLRYSDLPRVTELGSDRAHIWTLPVSFSSELLSWSLWLPKVWLSTSRIELIEHIQFNHHVILPLLLTIILYSATFPHLCGYYSGPDQCNVSYCTGPLQRRTAKACQLLSPPTLFSSSSPTWWPSWS